MSATQPSNKTGFTRGLATLLLAGTMVLSMATARGDALIQNTGGIAHASGGVGADSIDQLNAITGNFNLKLVFALQSGNYVSDVQVVIADAQGKTVLDALSAGPWFLAKLPAGQYQVVATFGGKAVKRQVKIGKARLQSVDFRWAAE